MPTPEEVAKTYNGPQQRQWLYELARTPRDIILFLEHIDGREHSASVSREVLKVRIAEDQAASADKLERHTRTLVEVMQAMLTESQVLRKLTVALLVFTAALLVFTIALVVLEYRPHP